jgi:2-polyprenyl-6-methoxyphenol hydroxylase-like FAD-dependent oxidoreductase
MSRQHAIVVGASIAGLLAARILSDHFSQVTVVDRDTLPDTIEPRRGTPQAYHVHVLLRRGLLILEQLFPGLEQELARYGAPLVDWTEDLAWYTPAGWGPRFPSGFTTRTCSRPLLETIIRRRVTALPNVTFQPRSEVIGLTSTEDRSTVTGVQIRSRDQIQDSPSSSLQGGLVVDASGRSSRGGEWLAELGYSLADEITIRSFFGYATRIFNPPPELQVDWKVLMVRNRPPYGTTGGVIYPVEGNRWIVNIGGAGEEVPPTDEAGFIEFARHLIHPAFYDAIQNAESLSPIHGYRRTENRLRRYECMHRWPQGFIVIGDAAGTFNPVYGQGMTVAALEALALDEWLNRQASCHVFQKKIARVQHTPWLMATNEDARVPGVQGVKLSYFNRLIQNYMNEVQWLAADSRVAFETLMHVTNLVSPPIALFRLRIAIPILMRRTRKPMTVRVLEETPAS